MSNSETKETKKEIQDELMEWFNDAAEDNVNPPTPEFKERLKTFLEEVGEFKNDPLKFQIMGDGFLAFFKLDDEKQLRWLSGTTSSKLALLNDLEELETPENIAMRCFNFGDILFYTGMKREKPIYHYTSNTMLYVLTGEESFLTQKGFCLYDTTPQTKHTPYIPRDGHEGMFG